MQPQTPAPPVYVYAPAQFQGNAPPPGPPCLDLLPWVKKEQKEEERKRKEAIQKQKRAEDVANQKKKSGWFNQLSAVVKDVAYQAETVIDSGIKATTSAISHKMDMRSVERFQTQFPAYDKENEKLLWCGSGKVISGAQPVDVEAFVSSNYFSAFGHYIDRISLPGQTVKHPIVVSVPIRTILCIQPAVATFGKDQTAAPQLAPHTDATTVPTALMIFCADRTVHLCYQFSGYSDLFNVLDHTWRALVNTTMLSGTPAPLSGATPSAPPSDDPPPYDGLYPNLK